MQSWQGVTEALRAKVFPAAAVQRSLSLALGAATAKLRRVTAAELQRKFTTGATREETNTARPRPHHSLLWQLQTDSGVYASRLLRLRKEKETRGDCAPPAAIVFVFGISTREAEFSFVVAPSQHLQPCSGCPRPHHLPPPAAPRDLTGPRQRPLAPRPTNLTATTSPPPPQPARRQP
jgi:hypothetical protein